MIGRDMGGCLPLAVIVVSGMLGGLVLPSMGGLGLWIWLAASVCTAFLALGLLAYAKYPLYRAGKFLSVGSRELPQDRLRAYRLAWILVAATVAIQALLLLKMR